MQLALAVLGSLLFATGTVLMFSASLLLSRIIDEINAQSAAGERFSHYFSDFRLVDILRRHQELFPDSRRRRHMYYLSASGSGFFIVGTVLLRRLLE